MKIGIVGCGKIAEKHLAAYKKIGGIGVVVSDVDGNKARKLGQTHGIEWSDNPDELIGKDGIDVIDVCTPTPYHAEAVLKALANCKHVFCEKPLAVNLGDTKKIRKKISETGKIVMVGYLYRFHPAFKLVKEVLEEGVIGEPYYAIFRVGGRGSHKAWKHQKDKGGGAVNEMVAHMLDLAIWYFGRIETAENLFTATILKTREIGGRKVRADAEDFVLLRLRATQGAEVICEGDLITPSYMNYVEFHGTNGSIWASILDYFPTIVYCKEPRGVYNQGNNFFRFPRVDLFEKELRYFLESIQRGRQPSLNSIKDSVEALKIIESIKGGAKKS